MQFTIAPIEQKLEELPEGIVNQKEVQIDEANSEFVIMVRFPIPKDGQIQNRFGKLETTKEKIISRVFGRVRNAIVPIKDNDGNYLKFSATLSANTSEADEEVANSTE